jgi:chemotaxis response regulator CheB
MNPEYDKRLLEKVTKAIKENGNYYILLDSLSVEGKDVSMRAIETHANHKITKPSDMIVFYKALELVQNSLAEKYKSNTGKDINQNCDCPICTGIASDPVVDKALMKITKAITKDSNKKEVFELIQSVMKMDPQEKELLINNVNKATSNEEIKGLLRGC